MKEFGIALAANKLLVVACEPIAMITAVDAGEYPHASNALAYLMGGGQVIFHDADDVVKEILNFLPPADAAVMAPVDPLGNVPSSPSARPAGGDASPAAPSLVAFLGEPTPAFLAALKLSAYVAVFEEEGYDFVSDLTMAEEADLKELTETAKMKTPQARRFVAAVLALKQPGAAGLPPGSPASPGQEPEPEPTMIQPAPAPVAAPVPKSLGEIAATCGASIDDLLGFTREDLIELLTSMGVPVVERNKMLQLVDTEATGRLKALCSSADADEVSAGLRTLARLKDTAEYRALVKYGTDELLFMVQMRPKVEALRAALAAGEADAILRGMDAFMCELNDEKQRTAAIDLGAPALLGAALNAPGCTSEVVAAACTAVQNLAFEVSQEAYRAVGEATTDAIVAAMKTHAEIKSVQQKGAMALGNLIVINRDNQDAAVKAGAVEAVVASMARFPAVRPGQSPAVFLKAIMQLPEGNARVLAAGGVAALKAHKAAMPDDDFSQNQCKSALAELESE